MNYGMHDYLLEKAEQAAGMRKLAYDFETAEWMEQQQAAHKAESDMADIATKRARRAANKAPAEPNIYQRARTRISNDASRIKDLTGRVTAAEARVGNLKDSLASLRGNYDTVLGDYLTQYNRANDLGKQVNDLTGKLSSTTDDLTRMTGNFNTAYKDYLTQANRANELGKQVNTLTEKAAKKAARRKAAMQRLTAKIGRKNKKLAMLAGGGALAAGGAGYLLGGRGGNEAAPEAYVAEQYQEAPQTAAPSLLEKIQGMNPALLGGAGGAILGGLGGAMTGGEHAMRNAVLGAALGGLLGGGAGYAYDRYRRA